MKTLSEIDKEISEAQAQEKTLSREIGQVERARSELLTAINTLLEEAGMQLEYKELDDVDFAMISAEIKQKVLDAKEEVEAVEESFNKAMKTVQKIRGALDAGSRS